jgi:hypothetical protein
MKLVLLILILSLFCLPPCLAISDSEILITDAAIQRLPVSKTIGELGTMSAMGALDITFRRNEDSRGNEIKIIFPDRNKIEDFSNLVRSIEEFK